MATVPDFGALAQQQNVANTGATTQTNLANRPNQYSELGSITWGMNPDGTWGQASSLNPDAKNLFNTTLTGQQQLGSQLAGGLDYSGAPAMPNAGFGASQQVIDAWNALQQPGLDKNAAAARNRAAAMGLTIGSQANNDIERTIGANASEARNQGILRGTQEYGNVFNRGMAARQQGVSEATGKYNAALQGSNALTGVRNSLNPNEWVAKVPSSTAYLPQTIYGAAQDTFNANMMNENAARAGSQANTDSAINALRAAGGLSGVGTAASGLWNWGKNVWGGGNQNVYPDYMTNDITFQPGESAMDAFLRAGTSGD